MPLFPAIPALIKNVGLRLSRRRVHGAAKAGESRRADSGNPVKIHAQADHPDKTAWSGRTLLLFLPLFFLLPGCLSADWSKPWDWGFEGISSGKGKSPLESKDLTPDTFGIEIFFIRVPYHQRSTLQAFWQESDELILPALLRRDLIENGFRVAVQGASLSPSLAKLLAQKPPQLVSREFDQRHAMTADPVQTEPFVIKQAKNLLPGMHAEIVPYADAVPNLPLFWTYRGQTSGKTFRDARCLLTLTGVPDSEGAVLFHLTPIIRYGNMRQNYPVRDGMIVPELKREERVFEELRASIRLLPGHWLLIGPSSERPSGIGGYFFTRNTGDTEQKVVAIRLVTIPKK